MTQLKSALNLTQELIRFNTINPPGNEKPCADYLGEILESAGFFVSYHDFAEDRTSLVARAGDGSKPPLCFTGHIDTVPLGAMKWSKDPLAAHIEDNRLYGRGSSDMKSGVAAFVFSMVELMPHLKNTPGVVLVITAGEETGCEGAFQLVKQGDVLGEAGAIIVAEPSANYPLIGHKGALWLKARSQGITAHGSMPELGENAIYKSARAITKLEEFDFNVARHEILGKPTLNVGTVEGGMNINSVPDMAEVGIDIRTIPSQQHSQVKEGLQSYLGEEVEIDTLVNVGAIWTNPHDTWIREVFKIMTPILGEEIETRTASYFTDAAALTPAYGGAPTVILGPGEPLMAHQTDEYCQIDRIEQAVEAYLKLAQSWCEL